MTKYNKAKDETGLASIVVILFVMIIITLVTLGFVRLMIIEQRRTLDDSLSAQAFYAAESAVNDATQAIKKGGYTADKSNCGADATFPNVITPTSTYSCLIIKQAVDKLLYTANIQSPIVTPIKAASGAKVGRIDVSWQRYIATTAPTYKNCSGNSNYNAVDWDATNAPSILKVDVVPADNVDRSSLITNTSTLYLYPCDSSSGVNSIDNKDQDYSGDNSGQIIPVRCTVSGTCTISIYDTDTPNFSYYLRLKSLYSISSITVTAFDTGGSVVKLRDSQVLVDATGRATDVVRRIQVRVPINQASETPDDVIQSVDPICKQVIVVNGVVPATGIDPLAPTGKGNCQP